MLNITLAKRHVIGEEEVKQMNVDMLVHSGSYNLCINEEIQAQLQFPVVEKRKAETAYGTIVKCDVANNVKLRFKNRATTCRAMILPGNCEPLLGDIPLENLPARLPYLKFL